MWWPKASTHGGTGFRGAKEGKDSPCPASSSSSSATTSGAFFADREAGEGECGNQIGPLVQGYQKDGAAPPRQRRQSRQQHHHEQQHEQRHACQSWPSTRSGSMDDPYHDYTSTTSNSSGGRGRGGRGGPMSFHHQRRSSSMAILLFACTMGLFMSYAFFTYTHPAATAMTPTAIPLPTTTTTTAQGSSAGNRVSEERPYTTTVKDVRQAQQADVVGTTSSSSSDGEGAATIGEPEEGNQVRERNSSSSSSTTTTTTTAVNSMRGDAAGPDQSSSSSTSSSGDGDSSSSDSSVAAEGKSEPSSSSSSSEESSSSSSDGVAPASPPPVEPPAVVKEEEVVLTEEERSKMEELKRIEEEGEREVLDKSKATARNVDGAIRIMLEAALAPPPRLAKALVVTVPNPPPSFMMLRLCMFDYHLALTYQDLSRDPPDAGCPLNYRSDLMKMFSLLDPSYSKKLFLARLTDDTAPHGFPVLGKARRITDQDVILLPLNMKNHMGRPFWTVLGKGDPVPYMEKLPTAVWRGTTTGGCYDLSPLKVDCDLDNGLYNRRRELVMRWGLSGEPGVDVGFTDLVQGVEQWPDVYAKYKKARIGVWDMLKYRYLLAMEGNDVSTGLKWMLASGSTVFMATPRFESWAMESLLQPWIHYVPIEADASDLLDKVKMCDDNPQRCEAIAQRATEFIRFYGDPERSYKLGAKRLQAYLDRVIVDVVETSSSSNDDGKEKKDSNNASQMQQPVVTVREATAA